MDKLKSLLEGKKAYIVSIATVVYAISGVITGQITVEAAILLVLGSGGLASLRAAISKLNIPQ